MRLRVTIVLVLLALTASAQLLGSKGNKTSFVTLEPSPEVKLTRGQPAKAAVRFRVQAGYHVNSNRPHSDLMIPTELKFEASPAVTVGKIEYPKGEDYSLSFSKEKLNVYQGDVTIQVPVSVAKGAKPGAYVLKGTLRYQACNDNACFPPKDAPLEVTVRVQ